MENSRLYKERELNTEALEKANQSIAEYQDITTRSLIANDFVHRITNLIGTIPGWADFIKDEIVKISPRIERIKTWSEKIKQDVGNLQQQVDKLKEPAREVEIDITTNLKNMLSQIRIQYSNEVHTSQLEIKENILPTHPIFGLHSALSHAIHSIISNGIEAILEKQQAGTLEVLTSDYRDGSDNEWVKFEVKDTGIGIPEEDIERIFIPFSSTKGQGRGYGLWRAKTVIKNMGGKIDVTPSEGNGSTFTILLPKSKRKNYDN